MSVVKGWDNIEIVMNSVGPVAWANDKGNPVLLTGDDAERWEAWMDKQPCPHGYHNEPCLICHEEEHQP